MSNTYRFTGPPENWITGIGLGRWAVNEHNKGTWEKLEPGDVALLHSTARSDYETDLPSVIIGYAVIASKKWVKSDFWWIQEQKDQANHWPYVFSLDEVYLFEPELEIDFQKEIAEKSPIQIGDEVVALAKNGLPINVLQDFARMQDSAVPAFPVNGSASRVNPIYERLVLEEKKDFFLFSQNSQTEGILERIDEVLDEELLTEDLEKVRAAAESFISSSEGYVEKNGVVRIRKDNEAQKRRVARLEDYTCQVCGFRCEYEKPNGAKGWIIEVDHIQDKHKGGNEEIKNLWVLCPNCHKKKTRGVIQVNQSAKIVTEFKKEIPINDNHLGWKNT